MIGRLNEKSHHCNDVRNVQAAISDVVPSRSCASTEWHGACPSAGTFRVRLEGPATLWGQLSVSYASETLLTPIHYTPAKSHLAGSLLQSTASYTGFKASRLDHRCCSVFSVHLLDERDACRCCRPEEQESDCKRIRCHDARGLFQELWLQRELLPQIY